MPAYPIEEQRARAVKATKLLDALVGTGAPVGPDVVRGLSDEAWVNAEKLAGVRPSSPATRELVAHLAQTRADLAGTDPFAGFPEPAVEGKGYTR